MKLDHLSFPDIGWGYMPATEEIYSAFNWCQERINPRHVLEIGYHMGHSTTYQLEIFKNAQVLSISPYNDLSGRKTGDRVDQSDRHRMAITLKEIYGNRWDWLPGRTKHLKDSLIEYNDQQKIKFDFALVDGNHSEANATLDIQTCIDLGIRFMLIDNHELKTVQRAVKSFSEITPVKPFYYEQTFKGKKNNGEILLAQVRNPQKNML